VSYIDAFCKVNPTAVRETMEVIAQKLKTGAVIIGERHTWPDARAVILDLAAAGVVKKLFLEFADMTPTPLNQLSLEGGSKEKVGEFLRKNVGQDLKDDLTFGAFKVKFTNTSAKSHDTPIPMLDLIESAVRAKVLLYPYDGYHKSPESLKGMTVRNQTMGEIFGGNAKKDEPGVVLLVGSAHLNPKKHEGGEAVTLQALCDISPDRIFKLKGPKPTTNPDAN
jgi:hypothetical protein